MSYSKTNTSFHGRDKWTIKFKREKQRAKSSQNVFEDLDKVISTKYLGIMKLK